MCGIVGYITSDKNLAFSGKTSIEEIIETIMDEMSYRGPDGTGLLKTKDRSVYVGHLRLSIICLDESASQPYNAVERYILSFNGEIYNFSELAEKYLQNQAGLNPSSDTSVLYFLLIKYGITKTLALLRGQFAFFFCDQAANVAYLARDLYGEKPIYYYASNNSFSFCSEPNGLSKYFSGDQSVNTNSVEQYLSTGFIWGDGSGFNHIKKVPPDSYITIKMNEKLVDHSVTRCLTQKKNISASGFKPRVEDLEDLLFKAVEDCLRGDVDFGLLLSGGLDSTLISLIASKVSTKKLTSYTLSTNDPNSDEVSYARAIASYLEIENKVTVIDEDEVETLFANYSDWVPDLNSDPSMIALNSVCRAASADVKVLLSGDGGDELQYGYNRHVYWYYLHESLFSKLVPAKVKTQLINLFLKGLSSSFSGFGNYLNREALINKIRLASTSLNNTEAFYFKVLSSGSMENLKDLINIDKVQSGLSEIFHAEFLSDDITEWDKRFYLGDNVLLKSDRASMYASVELRSPFLDKRLLEWGNSLHPRDHIFALQNKFIARKLLKRHLPKSLIDRPKQGFGSPTATWMRGVLQGQITKLFKCNRTCNSLGFNQGLILGLWVDFLNNKNSNSDLLGRFAILFQWHRKNISNET